MTTSRDPRYAGYRFPAEVVVTAVWLYFRWFCYSVRAGA